MPECGYITLSMECIEGSRAPEEEGYTEDGLDRLNENLIKTVTICLWAKGGDKPDDTATPDYVQTFNNVNSYNSATFRIPLTLALKHVLFETTGAECHAFAAVNVNPPSGKFTIAELRNISVDSEFSSQKTQDYFTMDGDCVVSYDVVKNAASGNIDLQRSASKITLALDVDNIVEQTAIVDGKLVTSEWQADKSAMRVWLKGGLAESTLDPDLTATPDPKYFFDTSDEITYTFNSSNTDNGNNSPNIGTSEDPKVREYPYIQDVPFYTYPHRWTAEPDDYAATYMILSIPWMQVEKNDAGEYVQKPGTTRRTCYYQVPVIPEDSDPLELVRNVSYHVYLHVGLLGSFEPDVPLELENLEYSAAEWGTVNMDVDIPDVRYLVVDQNDYTVNNETSILIPFYTSHETIVTDATMTFYRYNFDDVGRELPVTVTKAQNEESMETHNGKPGAPVFTAEFNNKTKELEVSHELVMFEGFTSANKEVSFTNGDGPNVGQAQRQPKTEAEWNTLMNTISYFRKVEPSSSITDVNEYSRVEFKITLQHKDIHDKDNNSDNFKEVITITQYPGMYITAVPNYSPINSTSFDFSGAQGSTIINGNWLAPSMSQNYPSGNLANGWMTSIGIDTENYNFNPNMYLVTITTLPEGTPYRIGDPRSTDINNDLGSNTSYTNNYSGTKKTITTGINGPIKTGENKTTWTGQRYTWSGGGITVQGFSNQESIYHQNEDPIRTLSYYYPTIEDDSHKMMVAPKFRICSSYAGTTWILNRELARRRAAAYQEMGYAAGRWRLPTFGEVAFIMDLAAQYKIPRLFGAAKATWYYWCAQGLVCVRPKNYNAPPNTSRSTAPTLPSDGTFEDPTSTNPDVQRARFVYDEWYWGEADLQASGVVTDDTKIPVYTFTWGDKPY